MTNNNDIQVITTGDGSSSLFMPGLGETYHSRHGALRESMHVFIEAGLKSVLPLSNTISILEIGFGTGLNAWLTWRENQHLLHEIAYVALDTNPLGAALIAQLNYTEQAEEHEKENFEKMHDAPWNEKLILEKNFAIQKIKTSLQNFEPDTHFDLVYFDAFGPPVQPEMWTEALFAKLYAAASPGGRLVTYCAKGQVRRDLQSAGWTVERLPGPPGKREMLRATKVH